MVLSRGRNACLSSFLPGKALMTSSRVSGGCQFSSRRPASSSRRFFPQGHLTSMTMTRRRLRKDRRNAFVATAAANLGHKSRGVKNFRLAAICQSCGPDELDRLLRLDGFCKPNYHESETEGRTLTT